MKCLIFSDHFKVGIACNSNRYLLSGTKKLDHYCFYLNGGQMSALTLMSIALQVLLDMSVNQILYVLSQ
jgi:hypothetical protein